MHFSVTLFAIRILVAPSKLSTSLCQRIKFMIKIMAAKFCRLSILLCVSAAVTISISRHNPNDSMASILLSYCYHLFAGLILLHTNNNPYKTNLSTSKLKGCFEHLKGSKMWIIPILITSPLSAYTNFYTALPIIFKHCLFALF